MNISRALNLLILLVSITGFSALFLTNTVNPVFSLFFLLAVFTGFFQLYKAYAFKINKKLLSTGLYLTLLFLVADFFLTDTELISTLINLLLVLHAFKLLSDKKIRDYHQILLLSFFQVVASCVLTTSFSFGFILIGYLFLALLALIVLNIKKESDQVVPDSETKLDINALLRFEILIIVFVLALTSVFFLIMPRFNSEFLSGSFTKPTSIKSGFSDEITLGRLGEIKSDSSPVMRVYIEGHKPDDISGPIYWRGLALDQFNGTTWKVGSNTERTFYRENGYGDIIVKKHNIKDGNLLKQEIITEPIDTKVLFSADKPVRFSKTPRDKIVSYNNSYSLFDFKRSRIKYVAYSEIQTAGADKLDDDAGRIPEAVLKQYSINSLSSEKFKDFVKNLHEDEKSNYYNIEKTRKYLLSNYKYTRVLSEGSALYPIDDFLFRYKEGHCEYFASAMVLILREMGIPARIVTGFLGGEFNEYGNFYLVRESNAHAWVEVYFPENGWTLFDPTPEAIDALNSLKGSFIGSYIDFLKFRWSRYVIDFTRRDQLNFFENVNRNLSGTKISFQRNPLSGLSVEREGLIFFTVVIFSIIILRKKKISIRFLKSRPDKAFKIYKNILKQLEKKGFHRSDYQTSEEFIEEIAKENPLVSELLADISSIYEEIRFGGNRSGRKMEKLEDFSKRLKILLSDNKKHNHNVRK